MMRPLAILLAAWSSMAITPIASTEPSPVSWCLNNTEIVAELVVEGDHEIHRWTLSENVVINDEKLAEGFNPTISPNGCWVAYDRDGQLWVTSGNGEVTYEVGLKGTQQDWAQNWVIVYTHEGRIFATDRLGTFLRDLGVEGTQPDASPDSNWVAYIDASNLIKIVSIHGQTYRQCSVGPAGLNPVWTPNGDGLFFTSEMFHGIDRWKIEKPLVEESVHLSATTIVPDPTPGSQSALLQDLGRVFILRIEEEAAASNQPEPIHSLVFEDEMFNENPALEEASVIQFDMYTSSRMQPVNIGWLLAENC